MERSQGQRIPGPLRREGELLSELRDFMWVLEDWKDAVRGRRSGGMDGGPEILDHDKIFKWRSNRGLHVTSWQIDVMLSMDEEYVRELTTPLEDKEQQDG